MSSRVVTVAIAIGAINWFALESLWTRAKTKNGYKLYPAPRGLKVLYFVATPVFLYGAIVSYRASPEDWWVSAILMIGALAIVFLFPATILVSNQRIMSVRWFGLRRLVMKWNDVACVYSNPENNTLIVQDRDNRKIVHTMFNIDRAGLIDQLFSLQGNVLPRSRISLEL